MLNKEGFDLWANNYDKSVNDFESSNRYPFAGYKDTLNTIYKTIKNKEKATILDIGFGTGVLSKRLYDEGYSIFGIDFSDEMIQIAQSKMPNANLIQADFSTGLPAILKPNQFDYIVCTYAIHHLDDTQKISFINQCLQCCTSEGMMLIGDVVFENKEAYQQCQNANPNDWDSDEIYPVISHLEQHFKNIEFIKTSFCAGVIIIK